MTYFIYNEHDGNDDISDYVDHCDGFRAVGHYVESEEKRAGIAQNIYS